MDRRIFIASTLASIAALSLASCSPPSPGGGSAAAGKPDLVPIPHIGSFDPPSVTFCKRSDAGLEITVRNQGVGSAGQSITRVDFGSAGGPFDINTSALAPSAIEVLTQPIPAGCFDADCEFTIMVDHATAIDEDIEINNQVAGNCVG